MVSLKWNEADARKSYYEQGMERGMERGREEERVSMIRNLLLANTPMEYIYKASGWTEDKVRGLQLAH